MRLELKGLMTKCERIRDEHRGQWEEGLAKLVLAQKNQIAELTDRHARERRGAAVAIRTALEPTLKPVPLTQPHGNLSLLSPRRPKSVKAGSVTAKHPQPQPPSHPPPFAPSAASTATSWPPQAPEILLPPPTMRPSKMAPQGVIAAARHYSPRAATASATAGGRGGKGNNNKPTSAQALLTAPPSPILHTMPPRPFTSEHIPRRLISSSQSPRQLTSAR